MAQVKVVFIGGGSYQWGIPITRDMLVTKDLDGSELVLMDIDARAANDVKRAALATQRRLKTKWKIRTETVKPMMKLRPSLAGADFVIVSISTGGFDAMEHDLNIPWTYGTKQTVGDTVGPGGLNRALRNIPVFMDIMEDIQRQCPNAWVLNLTNPMTTLTGTLCQMSPGNPRVVGLCHEVYGARWFIASLLGLDPEEPNYDTPLAGINHCIFNLAVKYRGEDLTAELAKACKSRAFADKVAGARLAGKKAKKRGKGVNPTIKDEGRDNMWHGNTVKRWFAEQTGHLTMVGDRHAVEFFNGFTHDEETLNKKWNVHYTTIDDRRTKWLPPMKKNTREIASGKKKIELKCSHEPIAPIINAIANSQTFLLRAGNLPNVGQVSNLPAGSVVETPCVVTSAGVEPVSMGALPESLAAMLAGHCHRQDMIVRAGMAADKDLALAALVSEPLVVDKLSAPKMFDEMLKATKPWLPQFFPKRRQRKTATKKTK